MKKILSFVIALAMCMTTAFIVNAAPDTIGATVSFSSVENAVPGDDIQIQVTMNATEKLNSFAFSNFSWNNDTLEFTGFSDTEEIEDLDMFGDPIDADKMVLAFPLSKAKILGEVYICTLNFKVKDTAPAGKTAVSCEVVLKNTSEVYGSTVNCGYVTVAGAYAAPTVEATAKLPSVQAKKTGDTATMRFIWQISNPDNAELTNIGAYMIPFKMYENSGLSEPQLVKYDAPVIKHGETYQVDLTAIPADAFGTEIYAVPFVNGELIFDAAIIATVDGADIDK